MAQIQLKNVRLSYANIWAPVASQDEPDGPKKYSVALLFDKNDKVNGALLKQGIAEAIEKGKTTKWGGAVPKKLDKGVRDGDEKYDKDGSTILEDYEGVRYINAKASEDRAPAIVNRRAVPIKDQSEVYSGCYCNVFVDCYPYESRGNRGVAYGLLGIQKVADGEPLGSAFNIDLFDVIDDGDAQVSTSSVDDDDDDWD